MMSLLLAVLLGALPADEPQAKPAPPAVPAQDPDRPTISAAELKALRDNNIFAPKAASKRPPKRESGGTKSAPAAPIRPKAPLVTAIYLDAATQAYHVIVEDRNDASRKFFKEPKFMKAGDEWSGIKLESVTQDKAVFTRDGASKDVHIGEGIAEIDSKPLSAVTAENEGFDDGDPAVPAEAASAPSSSTSPAAPGTSKKSMYRSRSESGGESKSATTENQSRTLEEMKKRLKKNRPSEDQ